MALTAKKVYAILKRQISDMEAKIKTPIIYRGTVATADLLPLNPDIGDMYNIESKSVYGEAGMNVAWNGVVWDTMGAPIDMSLYIKSNELADWVKQQNKPTYTAEEVGALPVDTKIPSKTSDLQNDSGFLTKIPDNYLSGTDKTLSVSGKAADAKATGDKITELSADISNKLNKNQGSENSGKIAGINESGDIVPMFPVSVDYNEETNCLEFGSDQKMELNKGINLDSTLTKTGYAADAGAVGEITNSLKEDLGGLNESIFTVKGKENLSWIIGAVNKADGISVSHTKRIRSILFQADGGIVDINGDYQIAVAVYSGNNLNTFEKYIDFSTLAYRFEKGKYYVIVIKANPEVDFSDSDINDVLTHISIRFWNGDTKIESIEKKNDNLKKSVELVKNVGLNSDVIFSIGGLNHSDGSINDNMERLYSNIIFARKGSSICLKSNNKLKFAVYKYSDKFGNTFVSANALSLDDYEFTEDTYARILIESGNQNDLEKLSFNIFQFDLKELNDRVKYTELTQWTDKGYISISAVGEYTKFVVTRTLEWSFMVLPVSEGDKFIISGFGGNNSKLYAFTDRFGKVLERTEKSSRTQSLVIQAPENGYVIFNALRKNEHYAIKYNENNDDAIENRNLIVPPYMPDINKVITSVPNNKTSAMSYDEIVSAWDSLQKKYPNYISKTNLGKETSGSLDMYRYDFVPEIVSLEASVQDGINKIYTKNDYPIVIMGACIHGAERPCAKSLLNLMTLIANAKDYSILGWLRNNIHFVIIPLENPWGYKNDKRTNVNQVDLNRNFEPFWEKGENTTENQRYRGTAPLSEKETQYIDSVLKECADKAVCYYSFHTHGVFTAYNMMTNFSSPALYLLNEMQNIGMSVTKMITSSGWINHNLPEDSGYIGCMEMEYGAAMASYQAAKYKIPSACPEVMYRYYDGGTGEVYNTDLDCMNTEYMLYSVTNACAKFLYGN